MTSRGSIMSTIRKRKSVKGLLTSLAAGKYADKGQADEQVQTEKAQGEATHLEQAVPDPQPTEQQPAQDPQSTEQPPEQIGNDSLPPDDEAEELPDEESELEDEEEGEDEEKEPVFNDQDKADLPVQEGKFKH